MRFHVAEFSFNVPGYLHPQLLVEVPLFLYLRCQADGWTGGKRDNMTDVSVKVTELLKCVTLTLLKSRDELVDDVLHCSVMAERVNDK